MRELPEPRPTFVLARGAYDAPTERVEPGTPRDPAVPSGRCPQNRLGPRALAARARASADRARGRQPLLGACSSARGLVATPRTSAARAGCRRIPQLLDWLAATFVESGWDVKAMQRRIVLSATYRQSSAATPRGASRIRRTLARARPAYRLARRADSRQRAGRERPARAHDRRPERLPLPAARALGRARHAQCDDVRAGPRRRPATAAASTRCGSGSSPPPSAISFDAAERLFCMVSRQRTSTPLQALVLLNDPQYVEAARVLGGADDSRGAARRRDRITFAFRLLTGRRPRRRARGAARSLYRGRAASFAATGGGRREAAAVGERPRDPALDAAESRPPRVVASTVMNMDEAVNKR